MNDENKKSAQQQTRSPMIGRFADNHEPSEWERSGLNDANAVSNSGHAMPTPLDAAASFDTAVSSDMPVSVDNSSHSLQVEASSPSDEQLGNSDTLAPAEPATVGFGAMGSVEHEYISNEIVQDAEEVVVAEEASVNAEQDRLENNVSEALDQLNYAANNVQLSSQNNDSTSVKSPSAVSHKFDVGGATMVGAGPVGGASEMTIQEMSRQAALTKPQEMKFPLTNRGDSKIIKLVRFLIWMVVLLLLPVGMSLWARSQTSVALATNTAADLEFWGVWLIRVAFVLGVANLIWGILRWFKKRRYQQWGILRTIREIIFGGAGRLLLVGIFATVVFFWLAPWLNARAIENTLKPDQDVNIKSELSIDETTDVRVALTKEAQARLEQMAANDNLPLGEIAPCRDLCRANYSIAARSTRYFYFQSREFDRVILEVAGTENLTTSVLGRKNDHWSVLEEFDGGAEWVISDEEYDAVALAIVNVTDAEAQNFELEVTARPLSEIIMQENEANSQCTEFDLDKILGLPGQLFKMIGQVRPDTDYNKLFESLVKDNEKQSTKLLQYQVTLCALSMKPDVEFTDAWEKLKEVAGGAIEVNNVKIGDDKASARALLRYDPFVQRGGIWALLQVGDNLKLLRLQAEEGVNLEKLQK